MNRSMIAYLCSKVIAIEGFLMLLPCLVAVIYGERTWVYYLPSMALALVLHIYAVSNKPKKESFYAKEGLVTVAMSWILMSVVGAIPFWLSGDIPNYIDALFETISGFTTTGSSILSNVEGLTKANLFWRSFTHLLGGMGVLVFMLAIMPMSGGYYMHLMKAESPGPTVSKLVPKVVTTARILYLIYLVMTLIEMILLCIAGLPLFDAICMAMGTAGTGGFGILNTSCFDYTTLQQTIITIFMILFGVNFNVYFLALRGNIKKALTSEEVLVYLGIITLSIMMITINIAHLYETNYAAFHHAAFQVGSVITTTGFGTADFDLWPTFSKNLLVILMFCGACAGSTGGGVKVSRITILVKSALYGIKETINPKAIQQINIEGSPMDKKVVHSVFRFFAVYLCIFVVSVMIISLEGHSFTTTFTSVAATLNNIGPGLEMVGPTCNFGFFKPLSKFVFMFDMLAGRLEVLPMMVLITPSTWIKK